MRNQGARAWSYRLIALGLSCTLASGCTSWAIDRAQGVNISQGRIDVKNIRPLSATSDSNSIRICFAVVGHNSPAQVYTATAPDPAHASHRYSDYTFYVEDVESDCVTRGQKLAIDTPQLSHVDVFPRLTAMPIPPSPQATSRYVFRYLPANGHYRDISIFKPDQETLIIDKNPAFYAMVPLAVLVDIVAIPLYVAWMSMCGSCK